MKRTYEIFSGEDLKIAELILRRRLQMLVHSYIYYEKDDNIVSDQQWSKWAVELVQLQEKYPDIAEQVEWADAFEDWDASTGAFLPLKHPTVVRIGDYLLAMHKGPKGESNVSTKKKTSAPAQAPKAKKTARKSLF